MYTCYLASARNIKQKDRFEKIPEPFRYLRDTTQSPLPDKRNGEDVYPAMRREFQCISMCFHMYGASWLQQFSYHPESIFYRDDDAYLESIGHPADVITNDGLLKSCDEVNFGASNCLYDTYWPFTNEDDQFADINRMTYFDYGKALECEV